MKNLKTHLNLLHKIERKKHNRLIHHIHKKYNISKKTLFYVKEYGSRSHAFKNIIKESIKVLLFASIISSIGGFSLEQIKSSFINIIPFIILIPVLNNMIGNYGTIVSSRFSTMLHENKIKKNSWWKNKELRTLLAQMLVIALITATINIVIAFIISRFSGYTFTSILFYKIAFICILDVLLLIFILFFIAITAGFYFYKRKEDPNNFLIPITTSVADFGNMIILSILIIIFF